VSAPPPSGPAGGFAGDEVDVLVASWRRERPDLDVTPLEVLSRVTRLAHHLDRARRSAFAAHGLESWEFDVLSSLRRSGAPYTLSPGALASQTLVTSGTMTARVDKLVARGLVERHRDPVDGRGVSVVLTGAGAATVDAALADLLDGERALLAALGDADQARLADALRRLLVGFGAQAT
jgi:DNA-binding MarR family transcriptional regulator